MRTSFFSDLIFLESCFCFSRPRTPLEMWTVIFFLRPVRGRCLRKRELGKSWPLLKNGDFCAFWCIFEPILLVARFSYSLVGQIFFPKRETCERANRALGFRVKLPLFKICAVLFAPQNSALFEGGNRAKRCPEKKGRLPWKCKSCFSNRALIKAIFELQNALKIVFLRPQIWSRLKPPTLKQYCHCQEQLGGSSFVGRVIFPTPF